jgi:hypothetical protein
MASSGKKKTTMGKIMREARLRERKLAKAARKDARKHSPLGTTDDIPEISADTESPADGDEESTADAEVGISD